MGNKAKASAAALTFAVALVTHFEGKRLVAYLDPPGIPTICYGHTKGVTIGERAADAECKGYLQEDLNEADKAIQRLVVVPINDHVHAALLSFTLNVGAGSLAKSTLLKKLNSGDKIGACNQLTYCDDKKRGWGCGWAGKEQLPGLIRRRAAERDECLKNS